MFCFKPALEPAPFIVVCLHPFSPPPHPNPAPRVAFSEGLVGACTGESRLIEIPASRNNLTVSAQSDNRVENQPNALGLDFDITLLAVVPKAAIKATDALLLSMRKNTDVSASEVEEALALGMPVDVMDTNSRTLLVTAAFTRNLEAVTVLLKHGADPNKAMHTGMTALIYAAGEGHEEILRLLLEHGARTNAKLHLRGSALEGYTALHFACLQGQVGTVKMLLDAGADPSAQEAKGLTPLAVAKRIMDGGSHKGLKPADRKRNKRAFPEISKLIDAALLKSKQEM